MDDHKRECESEACQSERSLALIKEAQKTAIAEASHLNNKPFNMGLQHRRRPKRGPQSKSTLYEMLSEKWSRFWKTLYHRYENLPKLGAIGRLRIGEETKDEIVKDFSDFMAENPEIKPRNGVKEFHLHISNNPHKKYHDQTTIRKAKKTIRD